MENRSDERGIRGTMLNDLADRLDHMNVDSTERRMSIGSDTSDEYSSNYNESTVVTNHPHEQFINNTCAVSMNPLERNSYIGKQGDPGETGNNILIVTNLDPLIFSDQALRSNFESLFTNYDSNITFRYLKSFKRVRLDFSSDIQAQTARSNLNNHPLGNSKFKCYPAQMIKLQGKKGSLDESNSMDDDSESGAPQQSTMFLSIPKRTKQHLISPPVSPPAGWKPKEEGSPCIDVQILSAIANLAPGQTHELHTGSDSQPGIFVEVCEEPVFEVPKRTKIIPKTPSPCYQVQ